MPPPKLYNPAPPMNPFDGLSELQAKQRQIIGGAYYRAITEDDKNKPSMQKRLVAQVRKITDEKYKAFGWTVLTPPGSGVKDWLGAWEKVNAPPTPDDPGYKGDWDDMKDLARCTLVVKRAQDMEIALRCVKTYFGEGKNGANIGSTDFLQFHKEKVIKPDDKEKNPGGYSGCTVFVRSGGANASKGEIQINYPPMLYAKDLPSFRKVFGDAKIREIQAKYSIVPGGLGHALYEVYRVKDGNPIRAAYAAASKMYYDYFRSDPPSLELGVKAHEALMKLNPSLPGIVLPKPPVMVPSSRVIDPRRAARLGLDEPRSTYAGRQASPVPSQR